MAAWTAEQTARRLARGLGSGEGERYRPWLGIRDVPSKGVRTRQVGRLDKRMLVTLSLLERAHLMQAQRRPYLVQCKEQFPLPLDETTQIARRLGINPPRHKGRPVVVTTDLLLYFDGPEGTWREAVAVKPSRKLRHRRVNELLNIERVWWTDREVRWRVVTELELPEALIGNLVWIDEHYDILPGVLRGASVEDVAEDLISRIRAGGDTLKSFAGMTDRSLRQNSGTALLVFRHMLARGRWTMPLDEMVRTDRELDPTVLRIVAPGALGGVAGGR